MLVVDRSGIRTKKYFIPWEDVINVRGFSGRGGGVFVETLKGNSAYFVKSDRTESPFESKQVVVAALGMWNEEAARYLRLRAQLSQEIANGAIM